MSNIQNLLAQFLGSSSSAGESPDGAKQGGSIADNIPDGLLGGAAAGGLVALLLGNKKARKLAGKAAGYGGAAALGGLAYKAFQNWQASEADQQQQGPADAAGQVSSQAAFAIPDDDRVFEIALIKAMIAAAKADGHIDSTEQARIFDAVEKMALSTELKALVFDLLRQPIAIEDIARGVHSLEQRAEIYLASCLVIDPDDSRELAHLEQLAGSLDLPAELASHLSKQAELTVLQPPGS